MQSSIPGEERFLPGCTTHAKNAFDHSVLTDIGAAPGQVAEGAPEHPQLREVIACVQRVRAIAASGASTDGRGGHLVAVTTGGHLLF
jgi:hypothetical protein